MEGENVVTRSIIEELHSWDILEIKRKFKVVLLELSLMMFILRRSNETKWKVKEV